MSNKGMITTMVDMQDSLNTAIVGDKWKEGINSRSSRPMLWRLYAIQELGEFMECFPYKHWADISAPADIDNARMELVDLFHFLTSQYLSDYDRDYIIEKMADDVYFLGNADSSADNTPEQAMADRVRAYLRLLNSLTTQSDNFLDSSFKEFLLLLRNVDMTIRDLYTLYVHKNFLNKLRQANGYRDGTYIKLWDREGHEDNWFLQRFLEDRPDASVSEIEEYLTNTYETVKEIFGK